MLKTLNFLLYLFIIPNYSNQNKGVNENETEDKTVSVENAKIFNPEIENGAILKHAIVNTPMRMYSLTCKITTNVFFKFCTYSL